MELEIKHIAPYLPYNVKCQWLRHEDNSYQITNLTLSDASWLRTRLEFKLILRPLSDLTKEIGENEELFYKKIGLDQSWNYYRIRKHNVCFLDYNSIQKMLEYHFDIFGLIDSELAISIYEINK